MVEQLGDDVIGMDSCIEKVQSRLASGRNVIHGDPLDLDFWNRIRMGKTPPELLLLAIPSQSKRLQLVTLMRERNFQGRIVAITHYPDECKQLKEAGADAAFDVYAEAGVGLSDHALTMLR